jgi:hypothetical protein
MTLVSAKGSLSDRIRRTFMAGLSKSYTGFGVRPDKYLAQIQRVYGLPIRSFEDMFQMRLDLIDTIANQTVSGAKKVAMLEGAGAGLAGFITMLPDMSFLALITMRMLQKLSLIYGFEFNTEEEQANLWMAAATAAGVDMGRDFIEKEIIERFAPRVIEKIATQMSAEAIEQLAARAVPIISGVAGATLNYFFIREWGRRAREHFRQRHPDRRQVHVFPANVTEFPTPPPRLQ